MKIIAFTGAGISKASGIETFKDRPGIREKLTRTFARNNPEEYKEIIWEFKKSIEDKEPNDAHLALAEFNIPIITMNVDRLHEKAGSKNVLKIHGCLPMDEEMDKPHLLREKPVLYEDSAPKYTNAINKVSSLGPEDILLVIGASTYTGISVELRNLAQYYGATVIEIQEDAEHKVREFLNQHSFELKRNY